MSTTSPWAARAAAHYDHASARRYRAHDDELDTSAPFRQLAAWLGRVCAVCTAPIDALDLGCGTGRYFSALTGVDRLVGLDASPAMLAEARQPYHADRIAAASVTLIEGDLLTQTFPPARFDLVYAIGVLAEHVPLDGALVARVAGWLKPGGRFAFTTVHPASPSVPRTLGRRLGDWIEPATFGPMRGALRRRLLADGMYADEMRVHELLQPRFAIESLDRFVSEAHLHCLCVARRRATEGQA